MYFSQSPLLLLMLLDLTLAALSYKNASDEIKLSTNSSLATVPSSNVSESATDYFDSLSGGVEQ